QCVVIENRKTYEQPVDKTAFSAHVERVTIGKGGSILCNYSVVGL
uniref:Ovule protein n=1 Tax=Parascaris univalens TaxID=6257 RepID=A0A915CIB7_PARUN